MKFRVTFRKCWWEYGTIEIEAEDKNEVDTIAHDIASGDDFDVNWQSDKMDPQETIIDSIEEIE